MPPFAPLQRRYVARFVFECLFNLIRSCSSDCGPRIFEFPRKLDGNERLRRNQTLPRALPPSIPSPYFHAVTSVRADSQYLVLKMHMPQTSLRVNVNVFTIYMHPRAPPTTCFSPQRCCCPHRLQSKASVRNQPMKHHLPRPSNKNKFCEGKRSTHSLSCNIRS